MAQPYRSIGQVMASVKSEYPEISISKIRYLESEGLITPERAPSGYRRYSQADIERLRYVLSAQKNHYLPLKVIREHLQLIDQGLEPPTVEATEPPTAPTVPASVPTMERGGSARPVKLTRAQLLDKSGLAEADLLQLERQSIIKLRRGTSYYGWEALTVAMVARRLNAFGVDARHMLVLRQAAEREVALIEQIVAPYSRRQEVSRRVTIEVAELVMHAHAALMQTVLEH
ncbi:MAG: MerR family transcriptional regulator [Propionibacteriaceae bacterium]|jgi:DNA-binding transcriptional MerR regulator|nr:MerR family transcriptional regulator [Propionibacteriaceae bacterium]